MTSDVTSQPDVTLEIARESAHPRLLRIRVRGAAIGDLCFPTGTARDAFVATLLRTGDAVLERRVSLIEPYEPRLSDPIPTPEPRSSNNDAGKEP